MASPSYPPKLTALEKLDLVPAHLSFLGAILYASITGMFRGKSGTRYLGKHIKFAFFRRMLWRLSTRQAQTVQSPTNEGYEAFAKRKGVTPETVNLPHDAKGHWIGDKNAKNVVIYYHSGGFALPANIEEFQHISDVLDHAKPNSEDVAIFFLTYTLTPHGVYPTQLRQGVEALRYIIHETGRSPANVIIGGSSAGGNLTLGVLSHLSHPHEAIEPLEISTPLAGSFAMAPWVSTSLNFESVRGNIHKDIVETTSLRRWGRDFLAGQEGDNYSQPLLAPSNWWKDLKTKDVLIMAGSDEILLSSITQFVEKFMLAFPNTIYTVGRDEQHIAPIVNYMLKDKSPTEQGNELRSWLSARL